VTTCFAASLVAMAARGSRDSWPEAGGVAAQALALGARAAPLAEEDAAAWIAALAALRGDEPDPERKLARAAEVPLLIAEAAADVGELAALTAEFGDGTFRGDATAAALL